MEALNKKRIDWLDIAKGIAIICTIIGHSVPFGGNVRNLIFSFHMPLFFIIAGYTIKQIPYNQFWKATFKDFKRLIIPVIVVKFLQALIEIIVHHPSVKNCLLNTCLQILWGNGCSYWKFQGIGVVWFLIALFYAKLLFRFILNLIPNYREIFCLLLAFLFSALGKKIWLPQNFDLLFPAILFMDAGYVFRNKIEDDSKKVKIAGLCAFIFWIYMAWNKGIYIELATRQYPLSLVSILIALCGSLCIVQFSKSIENLKSSKVLVFIGKYSLDLLCIHQFDGYFSFLWKYISFSESTKLCKVNSFIQLFFHVIIDVIILFLWVLIKEKVFLRIFEKFRNKA